MYYLSIKTEDYEKFNNIIELLDLLPFGDGTMLRHNNGLITLYAFTTDKKLDKQFQNQRNMKYFIRKVHEVNLNHSLKKLKEIGKFRHQNSEKEIIIENLKNKDGEEIKVVCTDIEASYVTDTFKDNLVFLLNDLLYLRLMLNDEYYELFEKTGLNDLLESYPELPTQLQVDEVGLFINEFKLLLKS